MKIALVAEWLDSWRGGAETSTLQFLHHLMQANLQLHVYTRSRPASTPGMQVHTVSGAAMTRTRQSMTFAHRAANMINADSIDLVHAISLCRRADIYQPRGGTIAETIERNLALRRHRAGRWLKRYANHFNLKQRHALRLERQLLTADGGPIVVAISKYVVEQLKRHYDLPDERIRLIYNGIDPDATPPEQRSRDAQEIRNEFGIGPSDLLVVQVAHNFRLKGVARWMEALAALRSRGCSNVHSLVIGKGQSSAWERRAARLGLVEVLTFVGPSDRVPAFFHAADILVHPTYYDPCSRVVLEAMAAGLPCITTRWDGAAEMIEHGVNGFVLDDPWDVAKLAELVERLREPERRKAMGQEAKRVVDRANMADHARKMIGLYQELLSASTHS